MPTRLIITIKYKKYSMYTQTKSDNLCLVAIILYTTKVKVYRITYFTFSLYRGASNSCKLQAILCNIPTG